ncbi:hypothetical protein BOTBODRAFT_50152 [Botryobasidium botryosum FD-172 SS1]|uniref:Uncharacterized protein n=1 Tax=Botryobasidium botryosum (strain FD-172 SS1) TaxID=930990 RepID=A0A067NBL7_BOTB1|nr:hypothetical protein BOTBODRAFT_50152 [Botryobasidium botryosum FD-172 SS1]
MHALTILAFTLCFYGAVMSVPTLRKRATADNIVVINSATSYCLIVPKNAHTNIGDSETPGGEQTYCSTSGRTDATLQGLLADNFWSNVSYATPTGVNGGKIVQLTGCINAGTLDRLVTTDGGGQYDSSGGDDGTGNPVGSQCTGYDHYVEILEPVSNRACLRCCIDPADCPTTMDTNGCPNLIPGNYFTCG